MSEYRKLSEERAVTVVGLVAGGAGIAILWVSGVEFPVAIPPGLVILLVGALFVGLAPWRWAPSVGAFLGLFVTLGFLVSGGIPKLGQRRWQHLLRHTQPHRPRHPRYHHWHLDPTDRCAHRSDRGHDRDAEQLPVANLATKARTYSGSVDGGPIAGYRADAFLPRSQCVSDEPTDGTKDVGTPSFTRASLFVALVLLYFQPITASIIFKNSAATPLENPCNSSSSAS
jgi:hypothetical protein